MKKRMRIKSKVLAAVLLAGVLCAGTVAAQAGTSSGRIGSYYVSGSTTISATSAVARTDCSGAPTNARAGVRAVYYYMDLDEMRMYSITESDVADRGCLVSISAPAGNNESASVEAFHYVTLDGETWSTNTQETY